MVGEDYENKIIFLLCYDLLKVGTSMMPSHKFRKFEAEDWNKPKVQDLVRVGERHLKSSFSPIVLSHPTIIPTENYFQLLDLIE